MEKGKLIAAWCGLGKTTFCNKNKDISVEIEYWKYEDDDEYIKDVIEGQEKYDYVLLSTDPKGIALLEREKLPVTIIYPKKELREEYLNRYIKRDSPYDFIGTFMKNWNIWLDELKQLMFGKHIEVGDASYLSELIEYSIQNTQTQELKEQNAELVDILSRIVEKQFDSKYSLQSLNSTISEAKEILTKHNHLNKKP